MITRRLLRIKALMVLYATKTKNNQSLKIAFNELSLSIDQTHKLYLLVLKFLINFHRYIEIRNEDDKNKFYPKKNILNFNIFFLGNSLIKNFVEKEKNNPILSANLQWTDKDIVYRKLYYQLLEFYENTKYNNNNDYSVNKQFLDLFFSEFLYNSEIFYNELEDQNIFWANNLDYIIKTITKSILKIRSNEDTISIHSMYRTKEDDFYIKNLFTKSFLKYDETIELIKTKITNWDIDRIANIDKFILVLAIREVIDFQDIPVRVTMNEFIEIGKEFGTKKSGGFINGLLDKIIIDLKERNLINKTGKGLI